MTPEQHDDFKQAWNANVSMTDMVRRFGMSETAVQRWRKKFDLPSRQEPLRAAPPHFVEDVVKERLSLGALRKKHKATVKTIKRWAAETGVEIHQYAAPDMRKREVPSDWHQVAPTLSVKQLCQRYSMSDSLVRRLVRETGVKVQRGRVGLQRMGRNKAQDNRPRTELDSAAHHLRRYFSSVHRCDIKLYSENDPQRKDITWGAVRGVPNGGEGFYYVDSLGIVANETVVALAREKGWRSIYDE